MRFASLALASAACLWLALIVSAPLAMTSASPYVAAAGAAIYAAGGFICHQRPERSFHLLGVQLPVCARCAGLYASAALGAPFALAVAAPAARHARTIAVIAGLPTLVTWTAEMAGLAHPSNVTRAVAAVPLGFVAAWLVVGALRASARQRVI